MEDEGGRQSVADGAATSKGIQWVTVSHLKKATHLKFHTFKKNITGSTHIGIALPPPGAAYHISMASRSYVRPSEASTGSSITFPVIGQISSAGGTGGGTGGAAGGTWAGAGSGVGSGAAGTGGGFMMTEGPDRGGGGKRGSMAEYAVGAGATPNGSQPADGI